MTDQTPNMEQDMRQVFDNALQAISTLRDRTLTSLASHTRQAQELTDLKSRFEALNDRMTSVIQEAQKVREDLHLVISERDKYKRDAEDHLALAQGYEKERDEARKQIETLTFHNNDLALKLSDAERAKQQSDTFIERLRSDLSWAQDERARYQQANATLRDEKDMAQEQLKQVQARLSRLEGVVREIFPTQPIEQKPVELPGNAPSFRPSEDRSSGLASQDNQSTDQGSPGSGINERIDEPKTEEVPWWNKKPTGSEG